MICFYKTSLFLEWRQQVARDQKIGLVPTMGNLHEGHLSLVEMAASENDIVIITIFVNPKQFGVGEDLESYPRTLDKDRTLLKFLSLKNPQSTFILFAPENSQEIYENFAKEIVVNHPMTSVLCGAHRPGHFNGVTTVVYRLFDLIKPRLAYFGKKDFQQFKIIKQLVKQFDLSIEIIGGDTVRSIDGLALSSRNQYLTSSEREQSLTLRHTLKDLSQEAGQDLMSALRKRDLILIQDKRFQYLEILDSYDLGQASKDTQKVLVAGAFILGKTRLIDNIEITLSHA